MAQLALFGCPECGGDIPGTVSERFCDHCMRVFLVHSMIGIEHWVEHPTHTGYLISNLGRVKSPDRVRENNGGNGGALRRQRFKGRILTATPNDKGYLRVHVGHKLRRVHVLVLEAFIGPRPPNCETCHWDGVKTNCTLMNVRWDDRLGNEIDRRRHRQAVLSA